MSSEIGNMIKLGLLAAAIAFCPLITNAQLTVAVAPAKVIDQKAVVPLKLKNGLSEPIESARAVVFLLDEQGKMVGQSSKWVIGGTKANPALLPKKETNYTFIVPVRLGTSTNLHADVTVNRLILSGGKLGDIKTSVQITQSPQ